MGKRVFQMRGFYLTEKLILQEIWQKIHFESNFAAS